LTDKATNIITIRGFHLKLISLYVCIKIQDVQLRILFLLLLAGFCWNCAQQGTPSGGPKDKDPPVVLGSDPPNYSVRFEAKKILITFDEYIVLDNVNQELVISPPMEEKPEVKLRKKTIIIQFEEALKENTTYTFNFGSAIKDLHEGNKLLNFEYVFSTGDVLDSLSVKGTLRYAKDLTVPHEPITIMLYNDLRDSVPLLDIPLYVGRSDDSGVFSVNNLRADVYKVFALKDGNYNFLFDLPTEEIAFLDTSLIVNAEFARRVLEASGAPDSTVPVADSARLEVNPSRERSEPERSPGNSVRKITGTPETAADTSNIKPDSIPEKGPDYNSIYIDLMLFTEESEIQYLKDNSRDDRRLMQMIFARPLTDTFSYRVLGPGAGEGIALLAYFSTQRDTLSLWIRDSVDYQKDTLMLEVKYTVKDTANRYVNQIDTVQFTYREKAKKQKKDTGAVQKLTIATIRNNGEQHLHRDLQLDFNVPVEAIHDSLVSIYMIADSLQVPVSFHSRCDSLLPTRGWISVEWESFSKYRMVILPGAVSPIYGMKHDTVDVSFRTRDIEYYGQILLQLENVRNSVIIELISKSNVTGRRTVREDGLYTFSYLVPQDYQIKFTHDLNENGHWDTGKYLKKLQPEPVEFLPKKITVRSNWDHDVTMSLKK
jgi:hypothetical protein